ncbi:MAG: hypothetical protein IT445_07285 [Phycisphaeraceae bacterium]|nr:hypothetical protein [Phycisphaeraceae bacterium]
MRTQIVILMLVAAAATVRGQDYRPVDQTVEDLDPLAVSQRVVQPGGGVFSDRVSMYRPLDPYQLDPFGRPATQSYIYEQAGVRAWVSRPEYLVLVDDSNPRKPLFNLNTQPVRDGAFIELIPPGAVFDLTPPVQRSLMDRHPELDTRLDYRLDMRIGGPVNPLDSSMPPPILGYGNATVLDPLVAAPPRVVSPDDDGATEAPQSK